QLQQAQRITLHHGKLSGFFGGKTARRFSQKLLERAQHERERSAEFVAHVAKEQGLGAIDLSQSLTAFAFQLQGARIGEAGADLSGYQGEKAVVFFVESLARVDATQKNARQSFLPWQLDGNRQCAQ